jgi:CRISPR-associated protein Csm3
VKTEVSIDRVTSAANPRQMERVPAGAVFSRGELVYSIYDGDDCSAAKDIERLKTVFEGLQLLEDDYLGGLGTRGSGQVELKEIKVSLRAGGDYLTNVIDSTPKPYENLEACVSDLPNLLKTASEKLALAK